MRKTIYLCLEVLVLLILPVRVSGAEKFTTIYSSRVMAQSLPWIAQEAGLFKKYNIDHNLVFVASSSIVTVALLGRGCEDRSLLRRPLGVLGLGLA
jgi:hypothetical protein